MKNYVIGKIQKYRDFFSWSNYQYGILVNREEYMSKYFNEIEYILFNKDYNKNSCLVTNIITKETQTMTIKEFRTFKNDFYFLENSDYQTYDRMLKDFNENYYDGLKLLKKAKSLIGKIVYTEPEINVFHKDSYYGKRIKTSLPATLKSIEEFTINCKRFTVTIPQYVKFENRDVQIWSTDLII